MPWERDSSCLSWAVAQFGNLSMVFLHYFLKAYFLFFLQFVSYCRKIVVLSYLKEGAFISAPAGICNCLKMVKKNCRCQILRGDEKVWVCDSEAVCNHHFVQKDQRKKSRISATLFQSPLKIFGQLKCTSCLLCTQGPNPDINIRPYWFQLILCNYFTDII